MDGDATTTDRPVALVTGGNRGIGRETCRQLADRGFLVLLGARDMIAGDRAARELDPSGRRVRCLQLDVTRSETIVAAAAAIETEPGRLDVVVNNAAIGYDAARSGTTVDLDDVRRTFETNLFGAWEVIQVMLPLLRRSERGRIVNVSSEAGSLASMGAGTPAYSTSKAALNAMTRIVAAELRHERILVNAVCPGWTDTDMGRGGRPVEEGAAGVVWAADLPDAGPTGGFFRDGDPVPW